MAGTPKNNNKNKQSEFDVKEFAYWFENMRKTAGLTIQQVSDELGISVGTISGWENGKVRRINKREYIEFRMKRFIKQEMERKRKEEKEWYK